MDLIAQLQEIDQEVRDHHIFCPRQGDTENDRYDEDEEGWEALEDVQRKTRIERARDRRRKFLQCTQLLAYDGEDIATYQDKIYALMDKHLKRCEICVRRYHIERMTFLTQLREDYDEAEIQQFLDLLDRRDIARIKEGLTNAKNTLKETPEKQRGIGSLNYSDLVSLFEALHCKKFHENNALVSEFFDEPFKLVQTRRPLRIQEIVPAATWFLFELEASRLSWAVDTWKRLIKSPNDTEWEYAIKDAIQFKIRQCNHPSASAKLWSALSLIVKKLDRNVISLKLFDLSPPFSRLALDHLARPTLFVSSIVRSLTAVLQKCPDAFWQSMGSISSSQLVESVFASPRFNECLTASVTSEDPETDVLSWIVPFLSSLKPENRPAPCSTLAAQLFERYRSSASSAEAKQACFQSIVKAFLRTICTFSEDEEVRKSASRFVITDGLDLVGRHIQDILNHPFKDERIGKDVQSLVRNCLALECSCLKQDHDTLSCEMPLSHQSTSYTPNIWNAVVGKLRAENDSLTKAAIMSLVPFVGLDEVRLRERSLDKYKPEDKPRVLKMRAQVKHYNSTFEDVTKCVGLMIDRVADFPPDHLDNLFALNETSMILLSALFSGDSNIYQAAVQLIKNISGTPGRKEALGHILKAFFSSALYGIDWVFRRLANMRGLNHVPQMLRTGRDILEVMCDPDDGVLYTERIDKRGHGAILHYWSYQWAALTTVFRYTEAWSIQIHDKDLMMDVCRDTMQYAQELFSKYHLFRQKLRDAYPEKADESEKALLNTDEASSYASPAKALYLMSAWLRLRDQYLANTLVNLLTSMLSALKDYGTTLEEPNLHYIMAVVIPGFESQEKGIRSIKTILNAQQKGELVRAVETYLGKAIILHPSAKKQSTLNKWAVYTDRSGDSAPSSRAISVDEDEFADADLDDADLQELISKHDFMEKPKSRYAELEKKNNKNLVPGVTPVALPVQSKSSVALLREHRAQELKAKQAETSKAFIEKRKAEQAANKLRRQEAALKLRGEMGVGEQTSGAGSGLDGLGVKGKDHSAGQSNIMVSSESESDSDEEDEVFGKIQTARSKQTGVTRHLGVQKVPIRKIKQVRSQKDIRARLTPDLSALHRDILSWDFFAETDTPPSSDKTDYTLVSNTFKSAQDYVKTFQPLLVLEGWQSFRTAREDGSFRPFELKIANSLIVDNFFEINSVVPMAESRELGLAVADILLLSKSPRPAQDKDAPHCLARIKEITQKRGNTQIVYQVNSSNNPLRPHLNDKVTIQAIRVLGLTPLEREYSALMALQYYDLCDEIIRAKPSPLLDYGDAELSDIKEVYGVNKAQAKAVKSAMDNDAFTLIQGPPGSGKTKTISAIVGALLTGSIKPSTLPRSAAHNAKPISSPTMKKLLVCAPSNAAVDELVMRLRDGAKMLDGQLEKINVVRLGRSDAINANVRDVTLEELVNAKLNSKTSETQREDVHALMMEHKSISDQLNEQRNKMDELRGQGKATSVEDENLFDGLKRKKTALGSRIDKLREIQNAASREADLNRKRAQQEVLDAAHVLCATLSGSGHELFQGLNVEFETVIIDEAAQSIELSALIPLKYGCNKCILVGDPKQLPPTVLSRAAAKFQYEQSLFARMEGNHQNDVHLLDTQYRMHPDISLFPSKMFYSSRLKDGGDMAKLRARPWHNSEIFAPYRFFDVQGMSQAATKGHSLVNIAEIDVAIALYDRLVSDVPQYDFRGKVGIITPYKGQLKELRSRFRNRFGESILTDVDFNTTDAFQGRESEIIIFSCVRASTSGLGFLNDIRRMNVGLTRAKCSLWVLGNSEALMNGEYWRGLVTDAKSRDRYTDGDIKSLLKRPLLTADMMRDDVFMAGMEEVHYPSTKPESGASSESKGERNHPEPIIGSFKIEPVSRPSSAASRSSAQMSRQSSSSSVRGQNGIKRDSPVVEDAKTAIPPHLREVSKPLMRTLEHAGGDKRGRNGPSGGRFGNNEKANCNICGSNQHFSHNCNNPAAREASIGICNRCDQPGHTAMSCREPRCIKCGDVGHLAQSCPRAVEQHLDKSHQDQVQQQEISLGRAQQRAHENRLKKRLGEHAAEVPIIRTTVPIESDHKRKREDDLANVPKGPKAPRINDSGPSETTNGGLPSVPRPVAPLPPPRRKKPNADAMFMKRK